jgi:hypothetical protein
MKLSRADQQNLEKIYEAILNEDMTSAGVLGDTGFEMGIENTDWYAPGDIRNPYALGITTRKGKLKRSKRKKTKRSRS